MGVSGKVIVCNFHTTSALVTFIIWNQSIYMCWLIFVIYLWASSQEAGNVLPLDGEICLWPAGTWLLFLLQRIIINMPRYNEMLLRQKIMFYVYLFQLILSLYIYGTEKGILCKHGPCQVVTAFSSNILIRNKYSVLYVHFLYQLKKRPQSLPFIWWARGHIILYFIGIIFQNLNGATTFVPLFSNKKRIIIIVLQMSKYSHNMYRQKSNRIENSFFFELVGIPKIIPYCKLIKKL